MLFHHHHHLFSSSLISVGVSYHDKDVEELVSQSNQADYKRRHACIWFFLFSFSFFMEINIDV